MEVASIRDGLEWQVVAIVATRLLGGGLGWLLEGLRRGCGRCLLISAKRLLPIGWRWLLETTHGLCWGHLGGVGRDAPRVEAVEEDHAPLRVCPLSALKVEVDNNLLTNLEAVDECRAAVGQLKEDVLGVLAGRTRDFQNKLPHRKRLRTLHSIMNFLEFANYLHLKQIKVFNKFDMRSAAAALTLLSWGCTVLRQTAQIYEKYI